MTGWDELTGWNEVPAALRKDHRSFFGAAGDTWCDAAPALARRLAAHWRLRPDGPTTCGAVAWILPVRRDDGTPAVLKVQPVDDETRGEPIGLRTWDGDGAVRLLEHDPDSGTMLLERLSRRSLDDVPDDLEATAVIAGLLERLGRHPAPDGLRRLDDELAALLSRAPVARDGLRDAAGRDVLDRCAAVGHELAAEPAGDRLLHWDLHFTNVLAPLADDGRGPWLAIDPKPIVGDPGFELLAALHNRWEDVVRAGVEQHVRRRFDVLRDPLGLDASRAAAWTCVRVLQNLVWEGEQAEQQWSATPDRAVAQVLLPLVR